MKSLELFLITQKHFYLREYPYVPQGSGIVYIMITHKMHAEATKECPGRGMK